MDVTGTRYGGSLPRPALAPEMAHLAAHCGSPASAFLPAGLPRPSSAPDMASLRLQAESEVVALPASSPKMWRVVWCHERCHKPDNEGQRAQLKEVTGTAGASLVCLKKASKYADWLRKGQRPAYILLTDWREVKPCLGFASKIAVSNQPTFTVVLCEEQRHFERAHAWAEALPRRADPVHVCKDLNFLKAFLNKYSARAAGGGPRQPSFVTDPTDDESCCSTAASTYNGTLGGLGLPRPSSIPEMASLTGEEEMRYPLASSTTFQASMNVAGTRYGGGLPRPASAPEMAQLAAQRGSPASAFLPAASFITDPAAYQQNLQPHCQDSSLILPTTVHQVQKSLQVPWRQTAGAVVSPTMMAPGVAALPRPTMPPTMSPHQLEMVLRAAAPDTYED